LLQVRPVGLRGGASPDILGAPKADRGIHRISARDLPAAKELHAVAGGRVGDGNHR